MPSRHWEVRRPSPSQIVLWKSYCPFGRIRKPDRAEMIVMRDTASWLQSCLWSGPRYPQQLAVGFRAHSKVPSSVQLSTARHSLVFSLSRFQPKGEDLGVTKTREVEITKTAQLKNVAKDNGRQLNKNVKSTLSTRKLTAIKRCRKKIKLHVLCKIRTDKSLRNRNNQHFHEVLLVRSPKRHLGF